MPKNNRRDFNKLGLMLGVNTLLDPLTILSTAQAQSALNNSNVGALEMSYVQINLYGSPSRWYFDSILKPKEFSPFKKEEMISTTYSKKSGFQYEHINMHGIAAPMLWNENIKILNQKKNIGSLFENSMIIRGCNMGADGHDLNSRKLVAPFSGEVSLTGQLSDLSHLPLTTVQLMQKISSQASAPGAFKSHQGQSPVNIKHSQDYFQALFGSVQKEKTQSNYSEIIKLLNKNSSHKPLFQSTRANAKDLLKKNINLLSGEYEELVKKYTTIIDQAIGTLSKTFFMKEKLGGIELPITSTNANPHSILGPQMFSGYFAGNDDFRSMVKKIEFPKMAEQFAISEFLIKNKITSSILMMMIPPEHLNIENALELDQISQVRIKNNIEPKLVRKKGTKSFNESDEEFNFDTHQTGHYPDFIVNNTYFYVFSHCLLMFKENLRKIKKMDKTIIHLTTEFERTPKIDQAGSDHGWQGHTSTIITDKLSGLHLMGNIYTSSPYFETPNKRVGTWGFGAPHQELKGRHLSYRNIMSSMSYLMGVDSITSIDPSLIYMDKTAGLKKRISAINIDNQR
ncbi:MAG: hypothetical protein HN576_14800 [Bacteriovoracaceae bacterium]|nr:hypothetical protein [Bacteriovoracaceae bacterium]